MNTELLNPIISPTKELTIGRNEFPRIKEDCIIVHSGNDAIGGIIIQLVSKDKAVFLDFGVRMDIASKRYGPFSGADYHSGLFPLLVHGIIPPIPGIYRDDIPNHGSLKDLINAFRRSNVHDEKNIERLIQQVMLQYNISNLAVLLTHFHMDHTGNIPYLKPDIKLYTGQTTYAVMDVWEEQRGAGWKNEILSHRRRDKPKVRTQNSQGRNISSFEVEEREHEEVEIGKPFLVGGFEVTYIPVSHSSIGSCAVHIKTPEGKTIVYTGDIRDGKDTRDWIRYMDTHDPPDVLVIDGTNVGSSKRSMSEADIKAEMVKKFTTQKGSQFIYTGVRNFERIGTIVHAAKAAGKKVFVPLGLAHYIASLQGYEHIPDINDVIVYLQPKKTGEYESSDYKVYLRDLIESPDIPNLTLEQLKAYLEYDDGVVITTSQEQMNQFFAFQIFVHGGHYIHSTSEAYDQQGHIDLNRIKRLFESVGYNYQVLHSSGHFMEHELIELAKHIRSPLVIPIHTLQPERFGQLIQQYSPVNPRVLTHIRRGLPYTFKGGLITPDNYILST